MNMVLPKTGKEAMAFLVVPLLALFVGIAPFRSQVPFLKPKLASSQAPTPNPSTDIMDLAAEAIQLLNHFSTTCWPTDIPLDKHDYLPLAHPHPLDTHISRLAKSMRLYEGGSLQLPPTDTNHHFIAATMLASIHLQLYPFPTQQDNMRAWFHALASESEMFADFRLLMAQATLAAGIAAHHGAILSGDIRVLNTAYAAAVAAHELMKTSNREMSDMSFIPAGIADIDLDSMATWSDASTSLMRSATTKAAAIMVNSSDTKLRKLLADFDGARLHLFEKAPRRRLLRELISYLRLPLTLETNMKLSLDPEKLEQHIADSGGSTPYRALGKVAAFVAEAVPEYVVRDLDVSSACIKPENRSSPLLPECGREVEALWGDGSDWSAAIQSHRIVDSEWPHYSLIKSADLVSSAVWRVHKILQGVAVGRTIGNHVGAVDLPEAVEWKLSASVRKVIESPEKQGPFAGPPPEWASSYNATRCMDISKVEAALWVLCDETLEDLHTALEKIESAQEMVKNNKKFWNMVNTFSGHLVRIIPGTEPLSANRSSPRSAERPPTLLSRWLSMLRQAAEWCGLFLLVSTIMGFLALGFSYLKKGAVAKTKGGAHRPRAARGTPPASSAAALVQRTMAAAALREALVSDNLQKLSVAIKVAEESGVEKPLLKKARNGLHNLKKRRALGSPAERKGSPAGSLLPSSTPLTIRKSSASSPMSSPATPTAATTTPTTPAEDTNATDGEWTTSPTRKGSYMAPFKVSSPPSNTPNTTRQYSSSLPLPSSSPSPSPALPKPSPKQQASSSSTHHFLPSSIQESTKAQPVTPKTVAPATPSSPKDTPTSSSSSHQTIPLDKSQAQGKQKQAIASVVLPAESPVAILPPTSIPVLSFTSGPVKTLEESEPRRLAAPKAGSAPKVVLVRRTVSAPRRGPPPPLPALEVQEARAAAERALAKARALASRASSSSNLTEFQKVSSATTLNESFPTLPSPFNNDVVSDDAGKASATAPQTSYNDIGIAYNTSPGTISSAPSGISDAPAGDWLGCEDAPLAEMWRAAAIASVANQCKVTASEAYYANFSGASAEGSSIKNSNSLPSSPPPPATLVGSPGLGANLHGYGMAGVGQYGSAAFSPDSSLALHLSPPEGQESIATTMSGAMSSSTSGNGSGSVQLLDMLTSLKHIWSAPAADAGPIAALPMQPEAPVADGDDVAGHELSFMPILSGTLAALGFEEGTE